MRLAICNEIFGDRPLPRVFEFVAECGYDGIELAPFTIADDACAISALRRAEIRRCAKTAGLKIVGLHWLLADTDGFYLTAPHEEIQDATAEYLGHLARLCADLGGKVLVLGCPEQRNLLPGVGHDEAMHCAADVLQQVVPVLEETDVVLAIEPLAPAVGDFLQTAALAVRLAEMVGSPQVRLQLDCLAMSSEAVSIPELIWAHRTMLAHFHANDPNGRGPGFGQLDFRPILKTLREVDYRGWVSVEVFDLTPGVERLARQSIAYLRQCLAELAP